MGSQGVPPEGREAAWQDEAEARRRAAYASGEAGRERERVRQAAIARNRAEVLRRKQAEDERLAQEATAEPAPMRDADPSWSRRDTDLLEVLRELRDAVRELSALLREQGSLHPPAEAHPAPER